MARIWEIGKNYPNQDGNLDRCCGRGRRALTAPLLFLIMRLRILSACGASSRTERRRA